jgi:uncharacterized coiled-coil protein SlyX
LIFTRGLKITQLILDRTMSDQRLDTLEEKITYLEASNSEFSEEIFRQQQEIAVITKAHKTLIERLEALEDVESDGGSGQGGSMGSERPPHY